MNDVACRFHPGDNERVQSTFAQAKFQMTIDFKPYNIPSKRAKQMGILRERDRVSKKRRAR